MAKYTILTDCDGVLLDWETVFHEWMAERGHVLQEEGLYKMGPAYGMPGHKAVDLIRQFNETAWMAFLPSFRDAHVWLPRIARQCDVEFHVITSMSRDKAAVAARRYNLEQKFGSGVITRLISLDCGADKHEALEEYRDSNYWWIEDKPENCDVGLEFGLRSIIIDHPHNKDYNNPNVPRVGKWEDIFNIVSTDILDLNFVYQF